MELIFNARQLSRCPELPAGHGNYTCWKKSTASSSEQRRNSRLQDGKTLEGLQTRPDSVYEPMSVSRIFRLGQKESRWTPQQESSGIRFYRSFNVLVSNFKKDFLRLALSSKLYLGTVLFRNLDHIIHAQSCFFLCSGVVCVIYVIERRCRS